MARYDRRSEDRRKRDDEGGYGRRAMRGRDYSRIGRPYGDERYGRRRYDRDFGDYDPDYGYDYSEYERDYGRSDFNHAYNRRGDYDRGPGYDRDRDYDRVDYGRESVVAPRYGQTGRDAEAEGPHAGRGPQGYRRSSERIEEDVNERLTEHGYLDASAVRVSVEDSEVTLEGTVDSRRAKRLAEDIAESARGVRDVHNRLRISQSENGEEGQTSSRGR